MYGRESKMWRGHLGGSSWGKGASRTESRPDGIIYYDMTTKNNSTSTSIPDVFLNTSQNQRIIAVPKDYDVAIVRFSIPSDSVPIVKPFFVHDALGDFTNGSSIISNVTTNTPDSPISNLTVGMLMKVFPSFVAQSSSFKISSIVFSSPSIAVVTMSEPYTGPTGRFKFHASLFVVSAYDYTIDATVSMPIVITAELQTYEDVVRDINLQISYTWYVVSDLGKLFSAPFIELDEKSQLFSICSDARLITLFKTPPLAISFSDQLYQLFKGLPVQILDGSENVLEKYFLRFFNTGSNTVTITPSMFTVTVTESTSTMIDVQLFENDLPTPIVIGSAVSGTGIAAATTVTAVTLVGPPTKSQTLTLNNATTMTGFFDIHFLPPAYTAYKMIQGYQSIANWTPLKKIILTTSIIPVKSTVSQPPLSLSIASSGSEPSTASQTIFRPIMTDFEPLAQKQDYTPYQYFPQGPWRLIPMQGEDELRSVDLQTYWEDFNGNLNLFQIPPTKESSKLLAFVPRGG